MQITINVDDAQYARGVRLFGEGPRLIEAFEGAIRAEDSRWLYAIDQLTPKPKTLTKYQFMGLLTVQERIMLRETGKVDLVLADALDMMEKAQEVRSDDPLLAQMFGYCVMQNYITQERADALHASIVNFGQ